MTKIHLSRIESSTFKIFSYAGSSVIDYELEQCLILDRLDKILHYFVSVHLSDTLAKYKDIVMHKKKTMSSTWNLMWFD